MPTSGALKACRKNGWSRPVLVGNRCAWKSHLWSRSGNKRDQAQSGLCFRKLFALGWGLFVTVSALAFGLAKDVWKASDDTLRGAATRRFRLQGQCFGHQSRVAFVVHIEIQDEFGFSTKTQQLKAVDDVSV